VTRRGALGAVAGAAVLWGTAGTVQELTLPDASPIAIAAVRSLLGGVVLLAVVLARRRRQLRQATGHLPVLAVATAAMIVFQVGYLGGIRATGVALGTLVAIGSAPVWAGAFATIGGRPPNVRWWVATAVAIAGLLLLVAPGAAGGSGRGVALAAAAGAGYAGYTTAASRLAGAVDRVVLIAVVFTTCGLVLGALPAARQVGPVSAGAGGGIVWLGLVTVAAAYLLFVRGLEQIDAPTATTVTLAEPVTATLLAVTLVDERLSLLGVVGVVTLLAGLALAARVPTASPGLPPRRAP
jgi:DME family drug/metabolite transporter